MCANCTFTPEGQCSFPKWDLSGEITYKYYASEHVVIVSILLSQLKFVLMRNVTGTVMYRQNKYRRRGKMPAYYKLNELNNVLCGTKTTCSNSLLL